MTEPLEVVLYSRRSCHLCDDARSVIALERARSEFSFREVFVDGDDELERAYGLRVPVITVGGLEEFEFVVEPVRFRRLVQS